MSPEKGEEAGVGRDGGAGVGAGREGTGGGAEAGVEAEAAGIRARSDAGRERGR